MRRGGYSVVFLCCVLGCEPTPPNVSAVTGPAASPGAIAQPAPALLQPDSVYQVGAWSTETPSLVPGDGLALVESHCAVCHSTRYISGQPPLPDTAWQAIVDKMTQAYGAAIPADVAPKIVAYLQAHYSRETRHPARAATDSNDTLGPKVYGQNCAACHQITGLGLPEVFPPLVGHAPTLVQSAARRDYLTHLVLFGVVGEVQVAGKTYRNMMPPLAHLSDAELAAVLGYVLHAWGNAQRLPGDFQPITAAELTQARQSARTPQENLTVRRTLGL